MSYTELSRFFLYQVVLKQILFSRQAMRFAKFTEQKEEITRIMSDIGEEVTTEFEQDIVIEDPECFVLSEANMLQLITLVDKVRNDLSHCLSL